jgi:hypothetical protein
LASEEKNEKNTDMEKVTKILKERKDGSIQSFWISTEKLEKQFSSYQAQNKRVSLRDFARY